MKLSNIIIAALTIIAGCGNSPTSPSALSAHTIEYQVDDNKYAIVVVEDDGISAADAKKYALQKAAEITLKNGYRYLIIDLESEVSVIKSDKQFPSKQAMPRNLYYELIQSNNFGREPIEPGDMPPTHLYTGYRILFSCFKEKPRANAIDACSYAPCKK